MSAHGRRSGFTIVELLIVIAVIAVLSVVTIIVINPAQLLAQGRDSNRISDMTNLANAIALYQQEFNGVPGSANVVYVSIPDKAATSTAGDQCQGLGLPTLPPGYTYQCGATSTYLRTNGTGWIPANFQNMTPIPPFSALPDDPTNTSSSRNYYTYTTNGTQYEVTMVPESQKYKLGGSSDIIVNDGGAYASVFEQGTKLGVEPLDYGDSALAGYWMFNEGVGTTTYDYSGNAWNGSTTNNPTWVTGMSGSALSFNGTSQHVVLASKYPLGTGPATITAWIYPLSSTAGQSYFGLGFQALGCEVYNNDYVCSHDSFTTRAESAASSLVLNKWQFFAVVRNANGTLTLYVNGAQSGTANQNGGTVGSGSNSPLIADGGSGGVYGKAQMENIRFYSRALSAAEIAAMYKGTK